MKPGINNRLVLLALAGLMALLYGCAALETTPEREPVERRTSPSFELEGRMSASDGERAASGRIHWKHSPQRDELTFFNPMGQIAAQLTSSATGAALRMADGRQYHAPDADSLLPDLLGVSAPVEGLTYWVQAVAREQARVLARDAIGRPARISDQGWIINYTEYADESAQAPPRRLNARWGEARMRLIIDEWTPRS